MILGISPLGQLALGELGPIGDDAAAFGTVSAHASVSAPAPTSTVSGSGIVAARAGIQGSGTIVGVPSGTIAAKAVQTDTSLATEAPQGILAGRSSMSASGSGATSSQSTLTAVAHLAGSGVIFAAYAAGTVGARGTVSGSGAATVPALGNVLRAEAGELASALASQAPAGLLTVHAVLGIGVPVASQRSGGTVAAKAAVLGSSVGAERASGTVSGRAAVQGSETISIGSAGLLNAKAMVRGSGAGNPVSVAALAAVGRVQAAAVTVNRVAAALAASAGDLGRAVGYLGEGILSARAGLSSSASASRVASALLSAVARFIPFARLGVAVIRAETDVTQADVETDVTSWTSKTDIT